MIVVRPPALCAQVHRRRSRPCVHIGMGSGAQEETEDGAERSTVDAAESGAPHGAGFTLIEIMVGMAIGMIGIIVMMQVFSFSEGAKRNTTSADDAHNNGIIALNGLMREARHSGLGIADLNLLGCALELRSGIVLPQLAPVVINPLNATGAALIPPGDPDTDTLLVAYGSSSGGPLGDMVLSHDAAAQTYAPRTPTSYRANDRIVATPATRADPCTFASGNHLRLETVGSTTPAGAPSTLIMSTSVTGGSKLNGALFNLGQTPTFAAYAVRNGNLSICDFATRDCSDAGKKGDPTVWTTLSNNIVSMRVQYGHDSLTPVAATPADGAVYAVDLYDQTLPATACAWVRTPAIRLVLVARSGQYDKELVTTTAPSWSGSAQAPIKLSNKPDGSASTDWQHFRYQTFQTTVPLRNISWMGALPSC